MNKILYEIIEVAAMNDTPIVLPSGRPHPIRTIMAGPTKFVVEDVYWRGNDGNVYQPVIEAQFRSRYGVAAMYVSGNVTLDWASSGDISMFRPENRYNAHDERWQTFKMG